MSQSLSERSFHALGLAVLFAALAGPLPAQQPPAFDRQENVIYGHKFGTALVMDVFTPRGELNGAGVIHVVSGGLTSSRGQIFRRGQMLPHTRILLERGYVVFAVLHGSQPKYALPEIHQDMHRAVRFIRFNAERFRLDPDRIGIFGFSSGGQLALFIATGGEAGDPDAKDPVDQVASRVQAAVPYFPGTDMLNFGREGVLITEHFQRNTRMTLSAPFDFHQLDPKARRFERITDEAKILEIFRQCSPITHVSPDDPPTLIFHGDADKTVPIQQSRSMMTRFQEAGVESRLVVRPGAGHGWTPGEEELTQFAGWFDRHLAK